MPGLNGVIWVTQDMNYTSAVRGRYPGLSLKLQHTTYPSSDLIAVPRVGSIGVEALALFRRTAL